MADILPPVVATDVRQEVDVRFLKFVAIAVALLIIAPALSGPLSEIDLPGAGKLPESQLLLFLPLLGAVALLVRRGLRKHDYNPHYVTWLTTNWVYFIAFSAMVVLSRNGNFAAGPWYALAVSVTACLVWRTVAQERWLRGLAASNEQVRVRKTGSFGAAGFARGNNPAFFRWAHRVLAVSWIWGTIPRLVDDGSSRYNDNVAFLLMPACFLLIGGTVAAVAMLFAFPFLLLFAATGVGALWIVTLLAWLVYTALLRPHDGRTNLRGALIRFEREAAWTSMH